MSESLKRQAREDVIGSIEYWETGANMRTRVTVSEETDGDGKTLLFITERRAMRLEPENASSLAKQLAADTGQSHKIRQTVADLKIARKEWEFLIPTFCVKRMAELLETVAERAKDRTKSTEKETA